MEQTKTLVNMLAEKAAPKKKHGGRTLDLNTIDAIQNGMADVKALLAKVSDGVPEDDEVTQSALWAIEKMHTKTKKVIESAVSK